MQKNLSIILANTLRSKFYFNELRKNKIFIDKIIFYSTKKNKEFLQQLKNYKFKKKLKIINSKNINSKSLEIEILSIQSKYILFSGYNAELIKNKKILNKNLIHCHPGILPKYRGSTVIYYSMIESNFIYVSVFKLTKDIDNGIILFTKKFDFPKNKKDIENNFDHIIRAKTLISFLKGKKNKVKTLKSKYDCFYYISHPILRSIVLNTNFLLKLIK